CRSSSPESFHSPGSSWHSDCVNRRQKSIRQKRAASRAGMLLLLTTRLNQTVEFFKQPGKLLNFSFIPLIYHFLEPLLTASAVAFECLLPLFRHLIRLGPPVRLRWCLFQKFLFEQIARLSADGGNIQVQPAGHILYTHRSLIGQDEHDEITGLLEFLLFIYVGCPVAEPPHHHGDFKFEFFQ